jgi:hypothetical protein
MDDINQSTDTIIVTFAAVSGSDGNSCKTTIASNTGPGTIKIVRKMRTTRLLVLGMQESYLRSQPSHPCDEAGAASKG